MTVYDTRYRNFRALIGSDHGAVTLAARRLQKTQGQVSHFGGANPIKNIGHKMAREIEAAYGRPEGWLDQEHGGVITSDTEPPTSHPLTLDPHILAEAEKWVLFEEGASGVPYPLLPRAERLVALYTLIQADGGALSPANAARVIEAAQERSTQGERGSARPSSREGHRAAK